MGVDKTPSQNITRSNQFRVILIQERAMNSLRRWVPVIILICLPVFKVIAQTGPSTIQEFKDWQIVNRFRLFNPWFGLPPRVAPTLMNAGVNSDHFLTAVRQDSNLWPTGELVFYACLYGLSHGGHPDECRGLSHGNYHELFNWNPLTNAYQAPPGQEYPKGYRGNCSMAIG